MDLIKTIEEDAEVENFSDDSDAEVEYQPTKMRRKKKEEFSDSFEFVSSVKQYNHDTWDDLMKYVKRKARTKTDDKIAETLKNRTDDGLNESDDNDDEENEDEFDLSEDELKHDNLRLKEKRKKKQRKGLDMPDSDGENNDADFFEEADGSATVSSFYQMNLSRPLMRAIGVLGYTYPTPIQASTIPIALLGRDICGCAATGTGKTAAYMLPTLERLLYRPANNQSVTRVLVLVPTRELGAQVYQVSKQLCQFTTIEMGLAIGGLDLKAQETILRQNPDIVIATPGRLIDHIKNTPSFTLDSIEVLILDEADRMLDEYFAEQMKEIIKSCSRTRQTMLFSATMSEQVKDLAAVSLDKPVKVFVNTNQTVAFNLRQEFIRIRKRADPKPIENGNKEDNEEGADAGAADDSDEEERSNKKHHRRGKGPQRRGGKNLQLMKERDEKEREDRDREPILAALICRTFHDHCMIFVQRKRQAHRLHILLGLLGIKAGELHGNLTQQQRLESLKQFKEEQIDVLIATDVAARGLDIVGVKTVINFNMPLSTEHYIHRVGRTARAGRAGISVSLADERERKLVKDIIKSAETPVKNRIIPTEILDKYTKKMEALEPEIRKILNEERDERMFAKMEQQISKQELSLRGMGDRERTWFQSMKKRKQEKERLDNNFKATEAAKNVNGKRTATTSDLSKLSESKRKKKEEATAKKTPSQMAKQKVRDHQEKISFLRAKASKIAHKTKRIRQIDEMNNDRHMANNKNKRVSKFSVDLTNTSRRNTKKLRYDANSHKKTQKLDAKKKTSKVKLTNKAGENKFNKGKNFRAPRKTGKPGKKK
ncbi:probable ATP-dependent RNA helicase DDX27 [Contarinia nasturtii]|uniref:probable ATP-dependent RNA helicase DDX27 n=1 Tax=Contarinia nasturtii TaxID=265458 RepID=UPI0012D443EB|nr:probable ATP-dependent RNA helicase DDX27 [Contarinia nasturtii]